MPRSVRVGPLVVPALFATLLALAGCGKGARDWRADDHDQEPSSGGAGAGGGAAAAPGSAAPGDDFASLVDSAWQSKCQKCHGAQGHGDGPSGPMVSAADLSDPKLQDAFTDDQLTTIIVNGKGRMPPFKEVPLELVAGLIQKVRKFRGR
jgi:mono/diheme cytochrome c family protein